MNREFRKSLSTTFFAIDVVMVNLSWLLTYSLSFSDDVILGKNAFLSFALASSFTWAITSFFIGLYSLKVIADFSRFSNRTGVVYFLWGTSILLALWYWDSNTNISDTMVLFFAFALFGISTNRIFYLAIRKYLSIQHDMINRVLIIGFNDTAKKLAQYLEEEGFNTRLLGFVENEVNMSELTTYPVYSNIENAVQLAKQLNVHEIFSTISPEKNNIIYKLIRESEDQCLRFKVVPSLSSHVNHAVEVDFIKDLPVLSMRSDPLEDVGNRMKKRIFDVLVSGLVIILILSWMIPLIGLLIWMDSRGPIFFSQLRTGLNDNPFYCWKFRTMKVNAESDVKQATKNDRRITGLGSFLRKTSIDEFPQFINVFRGQMSIVGPRPHMLKHTSEYSKVVEHYMIRQLLKPGITGWAQVNGLRGEISNPQQIQQRVASDLWYLENWSIRLDLKIMLSTVFRVFAGDKYAY